MKQIHRSNQNVGTSSFTRLLTLLVILLFGLSTGFGSGLLQAQEAPHEEQEETQPQDEEQEQPSEEGKEAAEDDAKSGKSDTTKEEAESGGSNDKSETSSARTRRRRSDISRNSGQFLRVFEPVAKPTQPATVKIKSGKKTIAIGAIVDAGGFVLTKQSELRSPLSCELSDGTTVSAYVYGVHEPTDLALLKIDASTVPVIRWSQGQSLDIGNWLVTVRGKDDAPAVGIIGVTERLIRPKKGFMGVNLEQEDDHVIISNVSDDTPAKRAGVESGDVVVAVNGEPFDEITALIERVQSFPPGEEIALTLKRDDKEIVLDIVLADAESLNPLFERSNQQNTMGGNILSRRRQNFPLAVQHDTLLKPQECGGPVVNIDGEVVGINIARQGRVSSLMLPSSLVMPIVAELKSGQLAPAVVNKDAIDEINRALQDLRISINLSPVGKESAGDELADHKKEEDKARKNLNKAMKQLDEAREARLRLEIAMQNATSDYESASKEIERLEQELERLVSGTR